MERQVEYLKGLDLSGKGSIKVHSGCFEMASEIGTDLDEVGSYGLYRE